MTKNRYISETVRIQYYLVKLPKRWLAFDVYYKLHPLMSECVFGLIALDLNPFI